MQMGFKYDIIKGQTFDIGRTINPFKCDCKECTFLNCPQKNYVPKTKPHRYSVSEFIAFHVDEIKNGLFLKISGTDDLTDDFVRLFTFPKGTYWSYNNIDRRFNLITFSRSGKEITKGTISILTGNVYNYDLSAAQEKLANRMSKAINMINDVRADMEKGSH